MEKKRLTLDFILFYFIFKIQFLFLFIGKSKFFKKKRKDKF